MKLLIRRNQVDQGKSLFGANKGVLFSLYYRLILDSEEAAIVERYKLGEHPLTFRNYQGTDVPGDTVADALKGVTQTIPSVTILVQNEDVIKAGCQDFKVLLAIATTFGGEETVDI